MASSSRLITDEDVLCTICMEVFTYPVVVPCGHSFCRSCITTFWSQVNNLYRCPMCNETFDKKPRLCVNTVIASVAEKFNNPDVDTSGIAYVRCNPCGANNTTPAIKSCLVCLTSYCATHLQPHQTIPALKIHKLIQPVHDLEGRLCKMHHKPLELFCNNDKMLLCSDCLDGDHKTHKAVTFEVEMKTVVGQMGESGKMISKMIQNRQQKIVDLQSLVENGKTNAKSVTSDNWRVLNRLIKYFRRSFDDLNEVVEEKQYAAEACAKGFIKEIEDELAQLTQKDSELQQLGQLWPNTDGFQFLQSVQKVHIMPPPLTKDWDTESIDCDHSKVEEAVDQLQTSVMKEVRMLCDPDLAAMQRLSVKVVLDPDTAHRDLAVSEDGKEVTTGKCNMSVPYKPQAFDHMLNVLAKEGFNAKTFYFEVQVKGKTEWALGVAGESIKNKGNISRNPWYGYWSISLRNGNTYAANKVCAVVLKLRKKPQKIGVFVDYERGFVAFYDVEDSFEIYAFTGCPFTEKLFPFFSPGVNVDGSNSAPLIITPVRIKETSHNWSDDENYYDDWD